jgi:hypothetical protein
LKTIYLPAIERHVSIHAYCQAVRLAKSNPNAEFLNGLTTWWPTTGSNIFKQYMHGVHQRINERALYLCFSEG